MTPAQHQGGVLFIAPSAYPLGGVAVWLEYLVAGLRARGTRAVAGLVAGRWHDAVVYRERYPGLEAVDIPNPTGSAEGRIRAIERAITAQRPEIVVAVNIADVYPAIRRMRTRGNKVRLAMALHGIAADLLEDLRREADVVDAVIASNKLAAKLCVVEAGMPSERVMYAPCGVADIPSSRTETAANHPLRVVWVGRLEQAQKRCLDLPVLLAQLDANGVEIELSIAGDGPDRPALLAALEPWVHRGRVRYLGTLSPADVQATVYPQADVLLITSEWETGPIVLWEAMSAGVAVATCSYVGSGVEGALRHGVNCLMFPIADMQAAALCLGTLAHDKLLRTNLAVAGRDLVQQRYTLECSIEAWANSLDDVLISPTKPCHAPRAVTPAGRLDRLLGTALAESARSILGLGFAHASAGGEWPHAGQAADDTKLLELAAALDREGAH